MFTPTVKNRGVILMLNVECCATVRAIVRARSLALVLAAALAYCSSADQSASFNKPPIATEIRTQILSEGESVRLNLIEYFSDPDDDPLTWTTVRSNDARVVTVGVTGGALTLQAVRAGAAAVVVTANDGEAETSTRFVVTVDTSRVPNRLPKFRDCPECPEMAVVPSGTFEMGAQESERDSKSDERRVHSVTIDDPFAVGVYEVTFAEWEACKSDGGCGDRLPDDANWGREQRPVIHVSWDDAQGYVQWLSRKTEKRYRLLSEAEWEYAARAGAETAYSWGDGIGLNQANCRGCGSQWDGLGTAPVGSFDANKWGLYDMHGNVREWTEDCWNENNAEAPRDGRAWKHGICSWRAIRGGAWFVGPSRLRVANRGALRADRRGNALGFRVARALIPKAISDQSLVVGRDVTLNLLEHFVDDGTLAYTVSSSDERVDERVVDWSVTDSVLTLMPVAEGHATVTVTAQNPNGTLAEEQMFAVTVVASERLGKQVGENFRDCLECPKMVVVPSGRFWMGAPESEQDSRPDERPQHVVSIAAPFAVGVYEVTFAEWIACKSVGGCGDRLPDDANWGREQRPVIHVSWDDAQAYVQWLSRKTEMPYRLLSEAEWEYAARAGTTSMYSWGYVIGHNRANCRGCGGDKLGKGTVPVGSFDANKWGLYDMHGNVREWTEDCWNGDYAGVPRDGSAWKHGDCSLRAIRGGAWFVGPLRLRAANRGALHIGRRGNAVGFRVARALVPGEETVAGTAISDQSLVVGGNLTLDLSEHFTDDQTPTYDAGSSRPAVVRVSVTDSMLKLTPVARGHATVTVTAQDPDGNTASQAFAVTVIPRREAKDKFRDCPECPMMVVVPSGQFQMGAKRSESGSESDERPPHVVNIDDPFAVGMYEVTFAEWDACAAAGGCDGRRPGDTGWGRGTRPVVHVSWDDAQGYVQWLSWKTKRQYRLLSESEWEYAARAGTDSVYSWGGEIGDDLANCRGCGSWGEGRRTVPAGNFLANDWGLYDMHGNVREWTEDCWNENYVGAPRDGSAWEQGSCTVRTLRGGSWHSEPLSLRAANRDRLATHIRSSDIGFRVARAIVLDNGTGVAMAISDQSPVAGGAVPLDLSKRFAHNQTLTYAVRSGEVPAVGTAISDQSLVVGRDVTLDLSGHFTDDQTLAYEARSSNADVVRASVTDSVLTLMPVAEGHATVTVTVRDPDGNAAVQTFAVTVDLERQVGEKFRDCPECPEVVVVPSGTFRMGALESESGSEPDERPVHEVTIAAPFAVGVYEVTFAEWDACAAAGDCGGRQPSDAGWGRGQRPVVNVSWDDVQGYVQWLSGRTKKGYRLPSESEWEYVARAGTDAQYGWDDVIGANRANCDGCGSQWDNGRTAPAGSFRANAWGLYDMHGNVWEWVEDCWNGGYEGSPVDGSAWLGGDCAQRVLRGGSWNNGPLLLRAANRYRQATGNYGSHVGFRVVRTLAP